MNTSIKFILGSKTLSSGMHTVYLQIIKDRKKKNIGLGFKCLKENFSDEKFLRSHKNYKQDNQLLTSFRAKAEKIIRDFQIDGEDFSLRDFEQKFRGKSSISVCKIEDFFNEIILEAESMGKISSAKALADTKRSFLEFAGRDIFFSDITSALIEKYENFLRSRNNQNGGIAFKMRYLRLLMNIAIKRKVMNRKNYPFESYKISKLKADNNKRSLSIDNFKKFRDVDLSGNPDLIDSHNYFLFSIYARGMNFTDMAFLKWENIQHDRIFYKRSKTKHNFNIEINSKMKEILKYYKDQRRNTEYVFPILLSDNLTPKQIANRKHKVISKHNKNLKRIGELANIDTPITTYVARHSFATILKFSGTSVDKISELMGHSNVDITNSYLKDFENEDLDREVSKLLNL